MNAGGYTQHDFDVFADNADDLLLTVNPGTAGMACIVRDGTDVIDYRLFQAEEVSKEGLTREDFLTKTALEVSSYNRLRDRLSASLDTTDLPLISVVICTKDRPEWLSRLLQSLANQKTEQDFEIIVIDNNSESAEVKSVADEAGVTYVKEKKTGLNFARNRALVEASSEIVAFLDDDTTAEPEWFDNLTRVWAENPDAGCITGLVLPMSLENEAQVAFERDGGFRRALTATRHTKNRWQMPLHPCGPGEFGAGANMSVKREFVLGLGGFDEALDTGRPLPGGGDLDVFYRVIRGERALIYEPSVVVRHDHRREMSILKHQYYTWGLGFFAFLEKSKISDPSNLANLRQIDRWFWINMSCRLIRSLFGLDTRSPGMLVSEIYGGVKGKFGEYQRSVKRSRAIREAVE